MYIMTFHSPVCLHVLAAHNSRFLPFPHRTVANFLLFLVNIDAIFVLFVSFLLPNASHFWILFPLFCHFTLTLHGVFSSCARLLHWNTSLGSGLHSQLLSPHPPTWVLLPHQRWPCLLMYTALVFIPCFTAGRLSSPFPQWRTPLPVLSHLPPFYQWAASSITKLFGVALFSSLNDSSCFGACPLSFSPPLSSQLSSASPWEASSPSQPSPGPGWSPLASAQGSASSPIIFHKCWCPGCPPLSADCWSPLWTGTHLCQARCHMWVDWGEAPTGCQKVFGWEGCPSVFGSHSSVLQAGCECLGSTRKEVWVSHTATPLVRSHLVPGSVESREGQPAHMAPEPSLKLDPITSCSRFWNVLTLVMVCPTSSLYRKQTCWNHRRKQACSSCISGWGWKWSARNQLCLIYYTGNSLVALCLVVLTLQGALS